MLSLSTIKSISHNYENFNTQDPVKQLSKDLILKIFSQLNILELGTACCICSQWNLLANELSVWKNVIGRTIASEHKIWTQYFFSEHVKSEDNDKEPSYLLSDAFIMDCKKCITQFTKKFGKDHLILVRPPKTLRGRLTLTMVRNLVRKYFSEHWVDKHHLETYKINTQSSRLRSLSCERKDYGSRERGRLPFTESSHLLIFDFTDLDVKEERI